LQPDHARPRPTKTFLRAPSGNDMSTLSDRELVADVLDGRRGAFESLVAAHQQLCWNIVFRLVRHNDDAYDLCQETFLLVHRKLAGFRFESSLRTWIGRIAYNVAMTYLQRRRTETAVLSRNVQDLESLAAMADTADVEAAVSQHERARLLHAAVQKLPPLQRTILTLYYLDEASVADIAEITSLPEGTIKSHLHRSRQNLRAGLERSLGEKS
jgi:RNA polymerase sigma-70 factor (ECF subfamily)